MANITISVQSFLNSANNLSITIDDGQTVAQLKTAVNAAEGTPVDIMDLFLSGTKLTDATTLVASGMIAGSYIKTSNNLTQTGLWTKQQRQDYKLQIAALRRAATSRRSTYDINELPNPYNGNDTAPDDGASTLTLGRPWS
jgi:hypothetical protein